MGSSEGLHEGLAPKGWRGVGEGCAPPLQQPAPRDQNHQAAPAATAGRRRQGTRGGLRGTPPPLPSPPPACRRPEAGHEGGGPASPQKGPGHPAGGTPQPKRAQPRAKCPQSAAHSLPQCPLPTGSSAPALKGAPWAATEQRHPGMQHWRGQSDPPWCPPGVGG